MKRRGFTSSVPVTFVLGLLCLVTAAPRPAVAQDSPEKPGCWVLSDLLTPEQTLRRFHIALVNKDRKALRGLTDGLTDKEMSDLVAGPVLAPAVRKRMLAHLAVVPIWEINEGDVIELPGGKSYTVPEPSPFFRRVYLQTEGMLLPIAVSKGPFDCRVDVGQFLAVRRIMQEERKD